MRSAVVLRCAGLVTAIATGSAGLLALLYAISYAGSVLPALTSGQLSRSVSLLTITIGYAVLAGVACIIALARAAAPGRRQR
ncbi:hypothetical protein LVY72_13305 [Arthrobacter sp. I2-34]|uniref:Uncharacterized protein n=1 Tax=Arthrobacter hankyongi TaxID=2904801 RepID=A0ABS9L878_9MICC|nr:hypothetical protein [Arthrobacter hankyongi]MCG2622877.1 hypothetical protein [Arthrobacter hankyongi]